MMSTKGVLLTIGVVMMMVSNSQCAFLREPCEKNSDCLSELSQCDEAFKVCVCHPYSIEYNSTTCLQGTLLGFECKTDAQCAIKVPTSGCINGVCSCEDGFVAYRRHTCLAPSKLGEICFDNDQCSLANKGSHCKYVVPRVFGRCQCQSGKELDGVRKNCIGKHTTSKLGEICFDNDQCSLADKGSHCKYVVPRVFGRCQCQSGKELDGVRKRCIGKHTKIGQPCDEDVDCSMAHAFCQRKMDGSSVCTCEVAYAPSADRTRCLPTYRGVFSATSLGYACHSNIQCQLADPNSICNSETGVCDCAASNTTCNARSRGCHRSTFQCVNDGRCLSFYFVCDGINHCEDGSDEDCEVREKCPAQSFQCSFPEPSTTLRPMPSSNITLISDSTILSSLAAEFEDLRARRMPIKCISRAKLCDGVIDCDNGSDEEGCKGKEGCPNGTFQCFKTKDCVPEHKFCNAIPDCPDQSDEEEQECRMEFQPSEYCPYRCADGRCRSSAIVCSGVKGCSDGSDEKDCNICRCPRVS